MVNHSYMDITKMEGRRFGMYIVHRIKMFNTLILTNRYKYEEPIWETEAAEEVGCHSGVAAV